MSAHRMRVRFRTANGEEFAVCRSIPAFTDQAIETAIEIFLRGDIEVEVDGNTVYAMDVQTDVRRWLCNYGLQIDGPFLVPLLRNKRI